MTRCKRFGGHFRRGRVLALLLTALIVALVPAVPAGAAGPPLAPAKQVQPALLAYAALEPTAMIPVIVQVDDLGSGAAAVTGAGGQITRELGIIRALAARIPAQAVAGVAQAPGVRWVSLDGPVHPTAVGAKPPPPVLPAASTPGGAATALTPKRGRVAAPATGAAAAELMDPELTCNVAIDTSQMANVYAQAVRATDLWNEGPTCLRGQQVTLALVDSGLVKNRDIGGNLLAGVYFNRANLDDADRYGHGTFVAGIAAADGRSSGGKYIGIAPDVNLINARIADDTGGATESDVVAALQWLLEHKIQYNIRVVNLSLNSSVGQSYHTSPLDAAVEILWFNGIVVVVAAGNSGTANLYPPANDPFVITVGATDDQGTAVLEDDTVAGYSAYGVAETMTIKPDLVAPGTHIIAQLPDNQNLGMARQHPGSRLDDNTFRMSGTSMSAPMVSGAAALLLEAEPDLTPDQVKYRLKATANKSWPGYRPEQAGAGYLDVYAAIHTPARDSENTGLVPSQLLATGQAPLNWPGIDWSSVQWNSVQWNSVQWNSVQWSSVQWSSVQWNSVQWSSDYWGP